MNICYHELESCSTKTCCEEYCLTDNFEPQWLDKDKICKARNVVKKHFFGIFFAHMCGLVLLVHIKSILIPLLSTGNSRSVAHIFNRYFRTLLHIKLWYEQDIWDQNSEAHKSIMKVRKMHSSISQKLNTGKVTGKDNMSLSQFDMVITQFAFLGFIVLHPKQMGIACSQTDIEDLLHFWRGIGYLLGIEDRFNLCNGNIDDIKLLSQTILEKQLKPSIVESPPHEAIEMSRGIVNAIRSFIYLLTWESLVKYLFRLIHIPKQIKLSLYSNVCYYGMNFTFNYLLHLKILSYLLNYLLRFSLFLTNRRQNSIQKRLNKKYNLIFGECLGNYEHLKTSNQICHT